MIRDFTKLSAMLALDHDLKLMRESPEKGGRFAIWSLQPGGARVHATSAKAAVKRGFPLASRDLFDGGDA